MPDNRKQNTPESLPLKHGDIVTKDLLPGQDWKNSKFGTLTGYSVVKRSVASTTGMVAEPAKFIYKGLRSFARKDKVVPLTTDTRDPRARFEEAQKVYMKSDKDITRMTMVSGINSWLLICISVLLTIYAVNMVSNSRGDLISYIFPFTAHLFVIPLTIRSLFWNYQLRYRSLRSFREFKSSPTEWLPGLKTHSFATFAIAIVGAGLFLAAGPAMAQELPFLEDHAPTDIFMRTVSTLAGGVGPVPDSLFEGQVSPWITPLAEAFRVFNTTLLAVASGMLGWHTLSGMIATAQEGQVLGQRWHQIWAPVRVTAGVGTLVPMASGFSAIQILVLQIALWGSALANTVWYTFVDQFADAGYIGGIESQERKKGYSQALFDLQKDDDGRELIVGLFEKSVCLIGMNDVARYYANLHEIKTGETIENILDMTPAQMSSVFGSSLSGNNAIANLGPVDLNSPLSAQSGYRLSLEELGNARVDHHVGLKKDGLISDVPASSWGEVKGATPVLTWNYGRLCGSASIDFAETNALQSFIAKNSEDGSKMSQAASIIENAASRMGQRIDSEVMEPIAVAANAWATAHMHPERVQDLDAYKADVLAKEGVVATHLAMAYRNYIDIINAERRAAEDNIFALVENENGEEVIALAKELGWASSGAFYITISRMNEHHMKIGQMGVTTSGVGYHTLDENKNIMGAKRYPTAVRDIFNDETTGVRSNIEAFKASGMSSFFLADGGNDTSWTDASSSDGSRVMHNFNAEVFDESDLTDLTQYWVNKFSQEILYPVLVKSFQADPFNALLEMIDLGHFVLTAATIALAIAAALSIAGVTTESVGNTWLGKVIFANVATEVGAHVLGMLASIIGTFGFLLIAVGVIHAYVIPMLPYIFMTFFVTGMLILIGEALVAAPIWAFMHIRMDGQEFVDQVQKPGYMIAFNLFLRPTLAIFGIILSLTIFSGSIFFLNETFNIAAAAAIPNDKGIAIFGVVSMFLIQLFLHYQLAIRSFQLITQVPDRVARWFGQGGENLNEEQDSRNAVAILNNQAEQRTQMASGIMKTKGQDGNESRASAEHTNATPDAGKQKK